MPHAIEDDERNDAINPSTGSGMLTYNEFDEDDEGFPSDWKL